jgi:hypothetical protein
MKNYKLDAKLLPEVWVTWMSKDGRIWMNGNGKRFKNPMSWMRYDGESDVTGCYWRKQDDRVPYGNNYGSNRYDKIWVNAGSQIIYMYAKYHKDIDRLEVAIVKYDTTRGEGKHGWMYLGDRLFIGKDKSVVDKDGNPFSYAITIKNRSTYYSARNALQGLLRQNQSVYFLGEFKKFIGHDYFIIGNGTSQYIQYPWHLQRWYDTVQKTRTTGKTQKLVDELVELPLGSIDHLAYKYQPIELVDKWRNSEIRSNIIYFERINDEWSVLRALIRDDNGEFEESWRVYLGDDGTNRIATKTDEGWIPSSQQRGWYFRRQYYFANKDEALEKCNRIKYIAPIIESEEIDTLITTLRFPAIEQLYKMGQTKLARCIAVDSTPKAYIKSIFGYYNEKEKNILRQIGMTKQQLDWYCSRRENTDYHSRSIMEIIREILGSDLSRVSNEIFVKYYNTLYDMLDSSYGIVRRVDDIEVDKSRFWKNAVRLSEKHPNAARLIADTLSVNARLYGAPVEVNWIFDDYSDIVRTHDALNALVAERDAERRAYYNMEEKKKRELDEKKRKETDEKRKHYEYEDDEFIIRLPKDVYEIINEGAKQCICIGGYTTRHSRGETNLFFLRRKDSESIPFYAIEMSNNKTIVQIHGHSNKWLGNNPEAIPTVVRWLRKNGIKCDNSILTCTARGYGRTNEYIEMPVVD